MRKAKGRRANLAPLACLVVFAACGGDAEPAADGGKPSVGETLSLPGEAVTIPPRTDEGDPGVAEGLEAGATGDQGAGTEGGEEAGEGTEEGTDDASAPGPPPSLRVAAGTWINLMSDEDISTESYRVDDPVIATVAENVVDSSGAVLIPSGVKLLGRVLASAGSGGPGEDPVLEIAFETLSAWHYERPVEAAVVEAMVVLDPEAESARRASGSRAAAVTVVPGKIMAGTVIVVELREPVSVPPWVVVPDSLRPGDSGLPVDTVLPPDTTAARDSVPPADSGGRE